MIKKYELIKTDTKICLGKTLFRIKALVSFGDVTIGELGGYVSDENCLQNEFKGKVTDNSVLNNSIVDNSIVNNSVVDNSVVNNSVVDNSVVDNSVVNKKSEKNDGEIAMEDAIEFTFSKALKLIKKGYRIYRKGWNGKNMYLELQTPDENSKMSLPYIYMKTACGNKVPWIASQTDLLATD